MCRAETRDYWDAWRYLVDIEERRFVRAGHHFIFRRDLFTSFSVHSHEDASESEKNRVRNAALCNDGLPLCK